MVIWSEDGSSLRQIYVFIGILMLGEVCLILENDSEHF